MQWLRQIYARFNVLEILVAWVGFGSGLLLLIPRSYLPQTVDLSPYFFALWCVMLACVAYFLGRLFIDSWNVVEGRWQQRLARRNVASLVQCLNHTEKAILREFVISRRTVLKLPVDEPAVVNLLHNGVLEMVEHQQLYDQQSHIDCMISLAARPLLSYRVLSLPVGKLTEEQLDRLKKMRPAFLQPDYQVNRTYSGKVFRIRTVSAKDRSANSPATLPHGHHHMAS